MQVIVPFRAAVVKMVKQGTKTPTYSYLPDDVADLPCQVVGRPSLREFINTPGVMTLSLDVTLLGRRIGDDDSQGELDALADVLFECLGGTKNKRVEQSIIRCTGFNPGTVIVAGIEYPAYVATVSAETISC